MGCCSGHSLDPSARVETTEADDLPPLVQQKTHSVEELRLRPANYVMRVREDISARYDLKEKIGEGGFGTVWKAVHLATQQIRAVKTVDKGFMDEDQAEKMLSEVSILRELVTAMQDHPNIIKVYEVIEDDSSFHIVSELCTGGDLFERVVEVTHFSEAVVARYMTQILSAIAYCHDRLIVHRDLKPENLLLETKDPNAVLKVIDFGTSSKIRPNRHLRGVIGTTYYMAPEVLKGRYNEKCDIWSCGVIMYILLCHTDEEVEENINNGVVSFDTEEWSFVSERAKSIVKRMLTVQSAMRPSARELLNDPWLAQSPDISSEDEKLRSRILGNLKNFRYGCRFKEAALQYIAWQLAPAEETEALRRVFISLDADHDGKLSIEDLKKGFTQLHIAGQQDVETIMKSMDCDGSGFVDYHEFLMATLNWKQVLSTEVMENAFRAFDKDGNGIIEVDELKHMLQGEEEVDSEVWAELLKSVDSDGNGVVPSTQIDFQEFKSVISRMGAEICNTTREKLAAS